MKSAPGPADDPRCRSRGRDALDSVVQGVRQVDTAETARRFGVQTDSLDWRDRLVCSA
jgi:hypothetical protein